MLFMYIVSQTASTKNNIYENAYAVATATNTQLSDAKLILTKFQTIKITSKEGQSKFSIQKLYKTQKECTLVQRNEKNQETDTEVFCCLPAH